MGIPHPIETSNGQIFFFIYHFEFVFCIEFEIRLIFIYSCHNLTFKEAEEDSIVVTIPASMNSTVLSTRRKIPKLVIPKITNIQKIFRNMDVALKK